MTPAIFGIDNDGLNLVVNLFILMLVVVWLALIVFTYLDARRRVSDPFLVACATVAAFIPYIGTAVYAILRPPEFLEDAHERELEIKAAELRVRQLEESSCPQCEFPIERSYLRCPRCQRRLKNPCANCGKPVDPRWSLCPYCEAPVRSRERAAKRSTPQRPPAARRKKAPPAKEPAAGAGQGPPTQQRTQRSPEREPDPDPRQA
ncbi:MAG TPA: zinc ribbon domain-containing protein [Solirubrobacterales bacterium]|jgi:hypothetical protein